MQEVKRRNTRKRIRKEGNKEEEEEGEYVFNLVVDMNVLECLGFEEYDKTSCFAGVVFLLLLCVYVFMYVCDMGCRERGGTRGRNT